MKNRIIKTAAVASCLAIACTAPAASGCGGKLVVDIDPVDYAKYTYNTYTATSPSNWNELSYQEQNDVQIMGYISSPFYEFDYKFADDKGGKFNADGSINVNAISSGDYTVKFSAATALEDVTDAVNEKWGYKTVLTDADGGEYTKAEQGGYAYKITLRQDLKWDDGTAIKAEDFVYSMKEMLNPLFMNYRAQEFYNGNFVIRNAKNYVFQGQRGNGAGWIYGTNYDSDKDSMTFDWAVSDDVAAYPQASPEQVLAAYGGFGNVKTVEQCKNFIDAWKGKSIAECLADAGDMKDFLEWYTGTPISAWGKDEYDACLYFCNVDYVYPELGFEEVGVFAPSEYEIVVCYDNQLDGILNDDGTLAYGAAYYLANLPLVKKDLYESCKQAPVNGKLWTSTYNSSLSTSASWGPYKLNKFNAGVDYELVKNANWYGYSLEDNKNQYQTDRIYCRTIGEWNTAWQYFQKGGIDDIGIDVSIASDYKNAERAFYTPSDLTVLINFQSRIPALTKEKGNAMLKYADFRKALTLGIDRAEYAATVTTGSQAALGLFNDMYYYDVANGGVYRQTIQAKTALLNAYGAEQADGGKWQVGSIVYDDADKAVAALTGYNLEEAKRLLNCAYDAALAAGDIGATDKVTLTLGFPEDNSSTRRYYNYLKNAWTEVFAGTKLAGRLNLKFDGSFGDEWDTAFVDDAKYDVCCIGGWGGGNWNMPYIIGSYIRDNRFAAGWDCDGADTKFEFTVKEAYGSGTADYTGEHTVKQWFLYLNGQADGGPSFVKAPMTSKLDLIAKLEEKILLTYWSCPTISRYSASIKGFKSDYITYDYNTFMSFGGLRYLTYAYDDAAWKDFVFAQKGHTLNYK